MIAKQDRAIVRKIINRATDGNGLIRDIEAALPHLTQMEIRSFLDDEKERLEAQNRKREIQQAAFDQMTKGVMAEFAKHPPGTTLGDLIDMERAKQGRH